MGAAPSHGRGRKEQHPGEEGPRGSLGDTGSHAHTRGKSRAEGAGLPGRPGGTGCRRPVGARRGAAGSRGGCPRLWLLLHAALGVPVRGKRGETGRRRVEKRSAPGRAPACRDPGVPLLGLSSQRRRPQAPSVPFFLKLSPPCTPFPSGAILLSPLPHGLLSLPAGTPQNFSSSRPRPAAAQHGEFAALLAGPRRRENCGEGRGRSWGVVGRKRVGAGAHCPRRRASVQAARQWERSAGGCGSSVRVRLL